MYGFGDTSTPAAAAPPTDNYWVAANYQAVLGRQPDVSGGQFWAGDLANGTPQATMTQDLLSSAEYCGFFQQGANCTTPPSDAQFLTLLYSNAFGRAPDASGYAFWLDSLGTGQDRATTVGDFITSAEFTQDHGAFASTWVPGQVPAPKTTTAATDMTSTYLMYGGAALLLLLLVLR